MKRIPYYIYSLFLCFPLFLSCSDVIPEGERYEELPTITPKRNILIEDFTGQLCTNCPKAHKIIADLKELYGNHVVAVAIHVDLGSKMLGIAEDNEDHAIGLMQPEGDSIAMHWRVPSLPVGLINRTSGLLNYTSWAAYSRQAFAEEPQTTIGLAAKIEGDSIVIRTETQSGVSLNAKLQLWITESNITAKQLNDGVSDDNYIHHHVYRAYVNGVWGEDVALTAGAPIICEHTIALRSNWVAENLSVVAFVYTESDGVLGVVEQHL